MSTEVVFAAVSSRFDVAYDQTKDQQLAGGATGEQHPLATRKIRRESSTPVGSSVFLAGSGCGRGLRSPLERVSRQIQAEGRGVGRRGGISLPRGLGVLCNARDDRAMKEAMQRYTHEGWTRKHSACTSDRGAQVQNSFHKIHRSDVPGPSSSGGSFKSMRTRE